MHIGPTPAAPCELQSWFRPEPDIPVIGRPLFVIPADRVAAGFRRVRVEEYPRDGRVARLESHFMATPCQLQFFRRVHLGRSAPINGYGDPAMLIYRSRTPLPGLLVWCSLSSSGSPAFDLLTVPSRASRTGRTLLGTPLSALARMSSVQRIAKRSDCSQEGTTEYLWTFSVSLISSERQPQAGP
jgi:hypothetical protein